MSSVPFACSDEVGMRLRFWGVRGSIPTPGPATVLYGGNTSCVELRAGGKIVILDAGTGLRLLGRELKAEFGDLPLDLTILLTHTHWDHIQGLPFFLPVYEPQNRLRILGYEGARNGLARVLTNQMESPFFPVPLEEVPANVRIDELKEKDFELGPIRVQSLFAYHPGFCVGYRLTYAGSSMAFFPDNELRHGPSVETGTDPTAANYDPAANQQLIEFLAGTDVLVMDAQYDLQEYRKHIGWGHACLDEVVLLALQANIKKLFLFHHDPNHDDAKVASMAEHAKSLVAAQGGGLEVDAAREGVTVQVSSHCQPATPR